MTATLVVIEDWDGDGTIRAPGEALQEMGVDVGDSIYIIEEYVGTTLCIPVCCRNTLADEENANCRHWKSNLETLRLFSGAYRL